MQYQMDIANRGVPKLNTTKQQEGIVLWATKGSLLG
jgi:hypothetical protein